MKAARTGCGVMAPTERKRDLLSQLKSVGPAISAFLSREVYHRQFANQRQVGSFLGLTPSPYDSEFALARAQPSDHDQIGPWA
jgi:transposase